MRKAIVLLVVLLAGCELFASDPFLGVWVYQDYLSLFFDQNGVVMSDQINHASYTGQYSYDDHRLTIEWFNGGTESMEYEFIGNVLRLYGSMDFVKR